MIILLLTLSFGLAHAELLVEVPISKNCTHIYSIEILNVGGDKDYYHASLMTCIEKNSRVISMDEASELFYYFETSDSMSFFLTDMFMGRYIIMNFIETTKDSAKLNIILRNSMEKVTHVVCLKTQNCTFWDESLPIFLTICGFLIMSIISLGISLCCRRKPRSINMNPSST